MSRPRIYAALVDGKPLGKRTTRTMTYTHAIVMELDPRMPKVMHNQLTAKHHVIGFSGDAMNAEKGRSQYEKSYSNSDGLVRIFVAPAVLIDKHGNLVEGSDHAS